MVIPHMSSAMPGRYPVSPAIAEEIRRYVEALQEQAAARSKGGPSSLSDLPAIGQLDKPPELLPPFAREPKFGYSEARTAKILGLPKPYTGQADLSPADARIDMKPAPRVAGGMPGMSAFSGSGPAQAAMPPGFKIGGQVGSLGGQMMMPLPAQAPPLPPPIEVGEHPFRPIPEGSHGILSQSPMRPPANIPPSGLPPQPPRASEAARALRTPDSLIQQAQQMQQKIGMGPNRDAILAQIKSGKGIGDPNLGHPAPVPRPPEFGQSPGGGMGPPMMPRMPGGDFSTMLNIARGGQGTPQPFGMPDKPMIGRLEDVRMGAMPGSPPQAPQPFGKDDLVSKMERPLGGMLDSEWIGGGEPKDGGILNGGMPPWMMNLFGGGFGGFGGF